MHIKPFLSRSPVFLVGFLLLNTGLCCLPTCLGRSQLLFSPDQLPKGRVGEAYRVEIQPTNATTPVFIFGIPQEDIPEGLTFTWEYGMPAGILEGVPEEAGAFTLNVSAMCQGTNISGQTGSVTYTLDIEE
ncbi:MAG: hypothetical protein JXA21_27300 [Anaerolineae bacterium]|nr:hypothetical protein [Anaerolineae bacterium]